VSISSDDDTDSTESDGEYDSERDSNVDMRMEDDVDTLDGVDLDGDVDMERDGEDEEDEKEEDDKEEKEVEEEEEEDDEDEDENNGKEPRTIGQGEMVNTSADDADIMVDDRPTVLAEEGHEMHVYAPRPQPPATAPQPHTPEPHPRPRTAETHTLSGLVFLGRVMPQQPRQEVPTLQEVEAARNTSDVNVEQQLLGALGGGDSFPDVPLPDIPLPDVPLLDLPLPDVPLPDVFLPGARQDSSVCEEWTSPRVAEEAYVQVRVGLSSCEFRLL